MERFVFLFMCIFLTTGAYVQSVDKQTEKETVVDSLANDFVLEELTVKGRRPTVRHTAEGIIVSVGNSEYLKSRSLDQILSISPGVSITDDGRLSINGIEGVTIMVNNKALRLSGSNLMAYLQGITGEELKELVIMPFATAKYDAEGNGGVLCINTKKKKDNGLSGHVASDYVHNTGNRINEKAGLSFVQGDFSIYGNYTYSFAHDYMYSKFVETDKDVRYNTLTEIKSRRLGHVYKFGFDWDISPAHYIGMEYNGSAGNNTSFRGMNDIQVSSGGKMISAIHNPSMRFRYAGPMNMVGLNYMWKTDTLGSRLSVAADYTANHSDSYDGYENHYIYDGSKKDVVLKDHLSVENIDIYSVQADFVKVFGKNLRLSLGGKYVKVKTAYGTNFFAKKEGIDEGFVEDMNQRDDFRYTEQRGAAYAMLNFAYGKWEGNAGLRGEYTWTDADSRVQEKNKYEDDDFRFFPSAFLSYKMENDNRLNIYYGMRINRPGYTFVNPYVNYISDLYAKCGYMRLKPAVSNHVSLGFTLRGKYVFTLRAFFEKKSFTEYLERREDGVTLGTFGNFGRLNGYHFYTYIPVGVGFWNSYNSLQVGFMEAKNLTDKASTLSMNLTSNNTFEITDEFSCRLDINFIPRNTMMYTKNDRNFLGINLGATCLFFDKKLSVTVSVDDIINSRNWYHTLYEYNGLERDTWDRGKGRTFGVSLRYNFGFGKKVEQREKVVSGQEERWRM